MGKRLYVGNLPYNTDDASLRATFAQDGRAVTGINIVLDRETGRPRGFAFVEMATEQDAKAAITALDGTEFGGRTLRVNEAEDRRPAGRDGGPRPNRDSQPRPGGGGPRPAQVPQAVPDTGTESGAGRGRWREREEDPRKAKPEKRPKRKHDVEEDYGGRRGSRRFDTDDDDES